MYDELICKLRNNAEFLEIASLHQTPADGFAAMMREAADAIEAMNRELKSLYKLLGTHPDPRGENGEAGVKCTVLSKTEKATQEQPSHSPSLGYYYAFLFDEATGKTYMPKEES